MKILKQYILAAMFLIPFAPVQLKAEEVNTLITVNSEIIKNTNEKETMARLKTIRALSKTNLSKSEKKALRNEVLEIKHKHEGPGGVVYISTGALILIIILLIILL